MMKGVMVQWTRKRTEGHFPKASIGTAVKAKALIIQAAKWATMCQRHKKLRDAGLTKVQ
jgi:hypothetical protein